jgi:tRNA threonylcarbamoyladenosine biosynthesis protein TsaE
MDGGFTKCEIACGSLVQVISFPYFDNVHQVGKQVYLYDMEIEYSLDKIHEAAERLVEMTSFINIMALHGEMGSGKTTLIQKICELKGVTDKVSSPTFSIINEYRGSAGEIIYHVDLYRLGSAEEARSAGVVECIDSGNLCFIEWPELLQDLLPKAAIHCFISTIDGDKRKLQINL